MRRAALVVLCALPVVARLLLPNVTPNDGFYGHAAFMLSRGAAPYHDFAQVAFPLAEGVLALAIRVFGHDLRTIEVVNALMIGAVALALHRAGRRLAGPRAGAVAALAWCWSLWVVHFNLFERETWAALGVALAFGAYARWTTGLRTEDARAASRAATAVALGLLAAFLVKITALFAAAGLVVHLLVCGRARDAWALAWRFGALVLVATLGVWVLWGREALVQIYLFGFFRNGAERSLGEVLAQLLSWTDPVTALGFAALLVVGLPGLRRPEGAPALVLLAQLLYALRLSPTLWDHNLIELAPASALLLGVAAARWPARRVVLAAAVGVIAVAIAGTGRPWLSGDYGPWGPGFGGWPRDALTRRGEFLARYSDPDDLVVTGNPWWAFAGGRAEAVRYGELEPVLDGLRASLDTDGLAATFAKRQGPLTLGPGLPPPDPRAAALDPFLGRIVANALAYTRPKLLASLARHEIHLVLEPLPPALLAPSDLEHARYERFEDPTLGLAAWRPAR